MMAGEIPEEEMKSTFNMGIGFCIVVPSDITIDDMECWTIGEVVVEQRKLYKIMADPYPALGSNYRPPIETYTTNRGLTLTAEEVEFLRGVLDTLPESLQEKVNKL